MKIFMTFLMCGAALSASPVFVGSSSEFPLKGEDASSIINFELTWLDSPFPLKEMEMIWEKGATPCISWLPKKKNKKNFLHKNILRGRYDSYLIQFAREAKSWGKPFLVRLGPEMNSSTAHWGCKKRNFGPRSPLLYKEIFRYVVGIFHQEKAFNALFVFCPTVSNDPILFWNRATNYYPGDPFVDVLAMTGDISEKYFKDVFYPTFKELKKLSPSKSVIVFTQGRGKKVKYALKKWKIKAIISDEPVDVKNSAKSSQDWSQQLIKKATF